MPLFLDIVLLDFVGCAGILLLTADGELWCTGICSEWRWKMFFYVFGYNISFFKSLNPSSDYLGYFFAIILNF